jgi:hypothetical protein
VRLQAVGRRQRRKLRLADVSKHRHPGCDRQERSVVPRGDDNGCVAHRAHSSAGVDKLSVGKRCSDRLSETNVSSTAEGDKTDWTTHGVSEPLERSDHRHRVVGNETAAARTPQTLASDGTERDRETLARPGLGMVEFPYEVEINLRVKPDVSHDGRGQLISNNDRCTDQGATHQPPRQGAAKRIRSEAEPGDGPATEPSDHHRRKVSWQRPHAGVILDDTAWAQHDSVDGECCSHRRKPSMCDGNPIVSRGRGVGRHRANDGIKTG